VDDGRVAQDIGVPEFTDQSAFVERARGFAEAEQRFAFGEAESDTRRPTFESGAARATFEQDQAPRLQ
jgi:hypothetical protein